MTLSKSKIFLVLMLAFILGVAAGEYITQTIMALSAMIFIILITMFWFNRLAKVIGFAGLVLLLGSLRLQSVSDIPPLTDYYDQESEVQAVIAEEPDVRSDKVYLTLGKLIIDGQEIDGKILATLPKHPEFEYGQTIVFTDKIVEPKDAEEKGEFSYKNYLSRFGISALTYYPKIELADSANSASKIKFYILSFKKIFLTRLAKILPEPQNSFLAGLLVGLRRGIPENLLEKFNITGTTHIIAISGFNITIIAQAVEKLLQGFGKRLAFVTTTIVIVLFVVMTGAPASVVRAGIMGFLLLISLNSGRLYAVTNAMVLTAVIMIGINPKILQFDIGFQLSFMALLGLVYLTPRIEPYFTRVPKLIRVYLVATLAAQIFVLPLLLYNFDRLSLIAPITNIMVLPVIPFAMLFGFLAGTLGLIWGVLGIPFAWVTWLLLTYIIRIVNISSLIPLASIEITNTHIVFVVIYYVVLVLWLIKDYIKWKPTPKESLAS
ncbi:MAG: ComEC/Rec2 family competence protein [bacterium]|nr:ComEC/Rec2 family competence protein [bacterium]